MRSSLRPPLVTDHGEQFAAALDCRAVVVTVLVVHVHYRSVARARRGVSSLTMAAARCDGRPEDEAAKRARFRENKRRPTTSHHALDSERASDRGMRML
jgi:hypothetical protein